MVLHDLKSCDLVPDWCEVTQERGAWQGLVKEVAKELNQSMEKEETHTHKCSNVYVAAVSTEWNPRHIVF